MVKQLVSEQQQLAWQMEQLGQPAIYDTTLAALGAHTLHSLEERGAVHDFFEGTQAGGPAVLDGAQELELARCGGEAEVVKFIAPVLCRLRVADTGADTDACGSVLVSTTTPLLCLAPDLTTACQL